MKEGKKSGDDVKKMIDLTIITILMMTLVNINLFNYKVYGAEGETGGGASIVGEGLFKDKNILDILDRSPELIDPDDYKPSDNPENADKLARIGNTIIGFLQIIGSILSVAVLAVLGIKYMIGSAEEKAEYKKTMRPYLLGAVMVFAITNILSVMFTIIRQLF